MTGLKFDVIMIYGSLSCPVDGVHHHYSHG